MTQQANILAFPAFKVMPVRPGDRSDSVAELPRLRRPRLLVSAARHGQNGYRRARDLRRLMRGDEAVPPPGQALGWLTEHEAQMDEARRNGCPRWDLQTHVLLLIALLAEMRLLRASQADDRAGAAASGRGRVLRLSVP